MTEKQTKNQVSLESHVFRWVLVAGLILIGIISFLFWYAETSLLAKLTFIPLLIIGWLFVAFHLRNLLQRHFFSLANVIESVRLGDFSLRVAPKESHSAWSEVYREINLLASEQQTHRRQFVEEGILLDKMLEEFDIPGFVFDRNLILRNLNKKGVELFAKSKPALLGLNAKQLQIDALLKQTSGGVFEYWFPARGGRWELRKNFFMQNGVRFQLVLVNDLSRTLREEERNAWLRLIRVLGHELNNSLASLMSVSQSLTDQLHEDKTPAWHSRYQNALTLIHERSSSLMRFTESYTRLAKLPEPKIEQVALQLTIEKLTTLVEGNFQIIADPKCQVHADPDQFEQVMINLMKNAVEASPKDAEVAIAWEQFTQGVRIRITDEGSGLPGSDNLFVPFFTTKAEGSGIGLFLCRQIVEAHGGSLKLSNRADQKGCVAECWFPKHN